MKKGKIIGLSLLTTLLVFSFINVSQAAPPGYVGVKNGATYTYLASVDMAGVNATAISLIGEGNWSIIYPIIDEAVFNATGFYLGAMVGAGIRLEIFNVTDEIELMGIGASGVFSKTYVAAEPGEWVRINETPTDFDLVNVLFDPAKLNESNFMAYLMWGGSPTSFLPKGFPYATVVPWINTYLSTEVILEDEVPGGITIYSNITAAAITNGFSITILGTFLTYLLSIMPDDPFPIPTFENVVVQATWNGNGILDLVSLSYGGLTLASLQLQGDGEEEIPGFIIPVFLGATALGIIGVISIIRRKKHRV